MASAIRIVVDPNDTDSRYIYFTDGLLDDINAPPVENDGTRGEGFVDGSPPSAFGDVPEGPFNFLQITDWLTPSGYIGDHFGVTWAFGAAANTDPFANNVFPNKRFVDFVLNPAGNGQGYGLTENGLVHPFGGAPVIARAKLPSGRRARRLYMDWTTKEYWVLDETGAFWERHGAPTISVDGLPPHTAVFNGDLAIAADFADITTGVGWLMNRRGSIRSLNGAQQVFGGPREAVTRDPVWVDMRIIEDGLGADPLRLTCLNIYGYQHDFTVSAAPRIIVGGRGDVLSPAATVTDTTRPELAFDYEDPDGDALARWELRVIASTVYDEEVGTAHETQRIAITGGPTGGTFDLEYNGHELLAVPYNVSAAALQTLIEGLPNVEPGDALCTGGPLPATPIDVQTVARLGKHNWPLMLADDDGLTGGATPTVVVTQQVEGSLGTGDPATMTAVYEAEGTDPNDAGHIPTADIPNGTLRVYGRVTDSSDAVSDWDMRQWVQNVSFADLIVPVLTPSPNDEYGTDILVETEASPHADLLVAVQYRDSDTDAWHRVRDAWQLVPDETTGEALAVDPEPPFGRVRQYRAFSYFADPYRGGTPSEPVDGPILDRAWVLTAPTTARAPLRVDVRGDEKSALTFPMHAGVFHVPGRRNPVVVTSGGRKGGQGTLHLRSLDEATYTAIRAFLDADPAPVLLVRDVLGRARYIRNIEESEEGLILASPTLLERSNGQPIRHLHEIDVSVVEQDRPFTGPKTGRLAEALGDG